MYRPLYNTSLKRTAFCVPQVLYPSQAIPVFIPQWGSCINADVAIMFATSLYTCNVC